MATGNILILLVVVIEPDVLFQRHLKQMSKELSEVQEQWQRDQFEGFCRPEAMGYLNELANSKLKKIIILWSCDKILPP